jgi:hypothetical protein
MSSRKKRSAMTTRLERGELVFRTERPQTRSSEVIAFDAGVVEAALKCCRCPDGGLGKMGLGTDVVCFRTSR